MSETVTTAAMSGHVTDRDQRVGGPYQVTATFAGFESQTKDDLFLKLGEDLPVNFQLSPKTIGE